VLESIIYPLAFVLLLWGVKVIELIFDLSLTRLGILPLNAKGLPGILLAPLIHADFSHLISNSFPLLVLGSMLFYFYKEVAKIVFILSVVITGFWVWVIAREAWHIGASGVVYSLAAFLFTSGVIRRHPRLMALSMLVVFLYGGMVWGIFPMREQVSWESHLMGMISGVMLALHFRQHGPQRKLYSWELEELEEQKAREIEEAMDAASMRQKQEAPTEEAFPEKPMRIKQNGHPEEGTFSGTAGFKYIYKRDATPPGEEKREGES
jgi:membrane associated rhomboid family serine protease